MTYYVIEFQTGASNAALVTTYNNRPDAEAKYFTILAAAAKSAVPKHGAMIITEDMFIVKQALAYREPAEQ